jgi:hypothetical protein
MPSIRWFLAFIVLAMPQLASAARTFASLTITPATTNITAGATVTANVALAAKASSGSSAYGPVSVYVTNISPSASSITTSINPNSYDLNVSTTNNSTLTVTTALSTPANTYTVYIVGNTNSSNTQTDVTPITNTYTMTVASAVSNAFSMSMSPPATNAIAGIASNVTATVTFLDYSATISGTVTNGVTVSPAGLGVTAGLNSIYAPLTDDFGQTNLILTISAAANAFAGTYTVVVSGTNSSFTGNSPVPGVASATNIFTVTDLNSFSMSVAPESTNLYAEIAQAVTTTVTFTDESPVLSGTLTNEVAVSPAGEGVTASLNNSLVSVNADGGQGALTLTINAAANTTPGIYQVSVDTTNNEFTANSPVPGTASVTYTFVVTAPPAIQSVSLSGTTLTLTGDNGPPYTQYVLLASTNLLLPLAQWTPVFTNAFDGNGNLNTSFDLSGTPNPNAAQQYFALLQETNILAAVATPVFSPIAAPYFSAQQVTISSATPGATIRFTTNGTTPTETYGTIYTNQVPMPQPVDTNTTGFLTDCSGVTMLKAIAYKSGLPDSAVFTGNFVIIVPPPLTSSSPLCGLADISYRVANLTDSRAFWEGYLGFAEPFLMPNSNSMAVVKINDQQYVLFYQGEYDPTQYQLYSYGYQVTNAEVYRELLASNGVAVSSSVTTNILGNLSFFSTDPDGHTNEWIQYVTNSLTGQMQGQAMPGTQLFGYMFAFGGFTTNQANADYYLIDQCGFDSMKTNDVHIPNNNGFYEVLPELTPQDPQNAGKTDKIDLINFWGNTISQTINILTNRNPSLPIYPQTNGTPTTLENLAVDVYDPDLSRLELDDCWAQ